MLTGFIFVSFLSVFVDNGPFLASVVIVVYGLRLMVQVPGHGNDGMWMWDFESSPLVYLSIYLTLQMLMVGIRTSWYEGLWVCTMMLLCLLIGAFSAANMFLFFTCFEGVLVPIVFIILGWGVQPERLQAVMYMVVYTIVGSFPLLVGFTEICQINCSMYWGGILPLLLNNQWIAGWAFTIAFIVKLPVAPFHLWLPKAHVEAPLVGSIALAGVLLKLGGYGLIRTIKVIHLDLFSWFGGIFVSVALLGGVLSGVSCFRQTDLNALVAYSSVVHITPVYLCVVSDHPIGVSAAIALIIGHGLCSPAIFVVVDVMYRMSGSRAVIMNSGYLLATPVLTTCVMLCCVGNLPGPVSLSFIGEALAYSVIASFSLFAVICIVFISFLSGVFNLYFYGKTQHGNCGEWNLNEVTGVYVEYVVCFLLLIPLNMLFLAIPW